MCGFTGFWQYQQQPSDYLQPTVAKMADMIQSRGPDSYGDWCDEDAGLALGHRRLAIIDLSPAGQQPMTSHDGRYIIAYNGELYNTEALKDELSSANTRFRGHSDTEILLEACAFFGVEKTLQKINGMFAFALWDKQDKCLFLGRDRLGIKPLYWGFHQGTLFFGSQVGTFTKHPHWSPEIDKQALGSYFAHNYIRGPKSIYQDINQISPGHFIRIDHNKQVTQTAYWSLDKIIQSSQIDSSSSEAELEQQLDDLLRDAVKSRMVSDVPLGAFLSGGIDSSTVVAMMQSQSPRPIKTFSIGFNEKGFNEAHYAKKIATHLGTEHYEHYFSDQDAMDLIPNLNQWYDEPFADSSQLPTYLVSKLAREHVTVSLSGDGGDELFAGYNRYCVANGLWKKLGLMPVRMRKVLSYGLERLSPRQIETLARCIPKSKRPPLIADKVYKLATVLGVNRQQFYQNLVCLWPEGHDIVKDHQYHSQFPQPSKKLDFISEMQFIDTLTYLPDDILTKVDRASMAISLEARVPLLDYRVAEFAWQLPMQYKLQGNKGKRLLTKVLNRYVHAELFERPKMGFGVPIGQWMKGPLREWAESLLYASNNQSESLINMPPILHRWQEHLSGKRNWEYSLWGVLMFLAWQEQWLN